MICSLRKKWIRLLLEAGQRQFERSQSELSLSLVIITQTVFLPSLYSEKLNGRVLRRIWKGETMGIVQRTMNTVKERAYMFPILTFIVTSVLEQFLCQCSGCLYAFSRGNSEIVI